MKSNKRSVNTEFHVNRGDEEIVLDVWGTVIFGEKGNTYGPPENTYPDEDDAVYIDGVLIGGHPWEGTLTDEEIEECECLLLDSAFEEDDDSWYDEDDDYFDNYGADDDYYDDDYNDADVE